MEITNVRKQIRREGSSNQCPLVVFLKLWRIAIASSRYCTPDCKERGISYSCIFWQMSGAGTNIFRPTESLAQCFPGGVIKRHAGPTEKVILGVDLFDLTWRFEPNDGMFAVRYITLSFSLLRVPICSLSMISSTSAGSRSNPFVWPADTADILQQVESMSYSELISCNARLIIPYLRFSNTHG